MEWQVVTSIATMYKLLSRNNSRIFVSALNSTFLRFVLTGGLLFLVDFVPEDAVIDLSEQLGPVFIGGNGHEPANIPETFYILN